MKTPATPLVLLAALVFSSVAASAKPDLQAERLGASCLLALGRTPSSSEIAEGSKHGSLSVADLIARHQQQLQADAALQRATAVKAAEDAFGRAPTERELALTAGAHPTYTELMQQHIAWLAANPAEYAQLIERAYQLVIHRSAFSIEIEYWNARPTLPFTLLVGCIENWGRRNAPGLMATTGIPTVSLTSDYLTAVRLSPAVAAEARAAARLAPSVDASLATAAGRNLVAAGADPVVTGGHIHFAAAGGPNLVPVRSAN